MSILGTSVRAGRGPEVPHRRRHLRGRPEGSAARRRALRHLRALDDGARHDHRSTWTRRATRRASSASSPPTTSICDPLPPGDAMINDAMRRSDPRCGHRPLRRRAGRRRRDGTARAGSRRGRAGRRWTTSRCRSSSIPRRPQASDTVLFPSAGTNLARRVRRSGALTTCSTAARWSSRQRVMNQRSPPCPLEVRGAAAAWADDGRLHYWQSTQARARRAAARSPASTASSRRRSASSLPTSAAASAPRSAPYPEEMLLPWLAQRARPARAVARDAHREHGRHGPRPRPGADGRDRRQPRRRDRGVPADGAAGRRRVSGDRRGPAVPHPDDGARRLRRSRRSSATRSRSSPTPRRWSPTAAPAGPRPQQPSSAPIDLFAAEIGMDPVEVRRRNLHPGSRSP